MFYSPIYLFTAPGLFGGDSILTAEQQSAMEALANINDPFGPQNAVVRNVQSLWRNNIVPYILDASLSESCMIDRIHMYIHELSKVQCSCILGLHDLDADVLYAKFNRGLQINALS